jgi:hypothetical protein
MSKKLKCPVCGTFNNKEDTIFDNQRYYCKVCYETKKKDGEDYKALIDYICDLYDIEVPNGWILKQIKEFKEQFNYTYKGMKTTLDYFYRIKQDEQPEEGMGIGIIPFVYDEAKRFYLDKKKIKDEMQDFNIADIENKKIIHVNAIDKIQDDKFREIVDIDISQLRGDE